MLCLAIMKAVEVIVHRIFADIASRATELELARSHKIKKCFNLLQAHVEHMRFKSCHHCACPAASRS
jgi:hypothetical protein